MPPLLYNFREQRCTDYRVDQNQASCPTKIPDENSRKMKKIGEH